MQQSIFRVLYPILGCVDFQWKHRSRYNDIIHGYSQKSCFRLTERWCRYILCPTWTQKLDDEDPLKLEASQEHTHTMTRKNKIPHRSAHTRWPTHTRCPGDDVPHKQIDPRWWPTHTRSLTGARMGSMMMPSLVPEAHNEVSSPVPKGHRAHIYMAMTNKPHKQESHDEVPSSSPTGHWYTESESLNILGIFYSTTHTH